MKEQQSRSTSTIDGKELRSPVTSEVMEGRVVPNVLVRNLIRMYVEERKAEQGRRRKDTHTHTLTGKEKGKTHTHTHTYREEERDWKGGRKQEGREGKGRVGERRRGMGRERKVKARSIFSVSKLAQADERIGDQ